MVLSVAVIARDEERHIAEALESAAPVADEIVVLVDSRTVDRTARIARAHGALVYEEPFRSHAAQRNRALARCHGTWVLFVDADERLTAELVAELQQLGEAALRGGEPYAGYWIPRYNLYWSRRLRGGGWYPDRQLRLLRRDAAHYDERRLIHEFAELDGPAGELAGHLLHINIESLAELRRKQRGYAFMEAQTLYAQGIRARPHNLLLQPLREVKRRFWTWQGYRDGWLGLFLALAMGYYELVKYIHLKGLERAASPLVASHL
ncbi:MAG: glycosyltransferase family 2 protein [Chloroflexota bacterium]|nr:glycosyltransferase family 2 protein [Chloroflexota bacterium]